MSAIPPISPASVPQLSQILDQFRAASPQASGNGSFASILADGLKSVETKVAHADELVKAFALDDSVPVHQVTYALEEARLAVELAMQVRTRLLEGYRELMNMQL
jgi:flagellar hook-basal body complex protein FliE